MHRPTVRRRQINRLRRASWLGSRDATVELIMMRAIRRLSHAIGDAIVNGGAA